MTDNITGIIMIAAVAALPVTALYLEHKDAEAEAQEIKAGTCPVKVATACGDEVCKYTARVPCAGLEELLKKQPEAIP